MYSLQTMHRLNNPALYELTQEEKELIRKNPMYPASMAVEVSLLYRRGTTPPWEQVRLAKALKFSREVMAELNARPRPNLRLVK